jgi:hypothetical protein
VTATATGLPVTTVSNVMVAPDSSAAANLTMGTPPPPVFSPIRVNAAGGAYTDGNGRTWSADTGFSGGLTWSVTKAIGDTNSQPLYQTCRYGNFSYSFTVPNGTYMVNLKFAEVSLYGPGQRLFNASINGATVLSNFDIFASAGGADIALDRSFTVNVTGGRIAIQFTSGSANLPLVSAIEITQGGSTPPPAPVKGARINAGGGAYTDPAGQQWTADNYYLGGATWSVTNNIANTATPGLYQTCRYGVFTYNVPLANGTYTVVLKFAEPSLNGVGRRAFNVAINGAPVLANFDVYAQAGGMYIAVDRSFTVNVTGGQIAIQFTTGTANLPMVSAIQISAAQ